MALHLHGRDAGALRPARFRHHHVLVGGWKLNLLDYGTAGRPPMLCVHGGAAHAHWYDFAATGFIDRYHVQALDHRGHGDSDWVNPPEYTYERYAKDLNAVAEKLDLRDFVLIGHSMGGLVSLTYAATHPGRVSRLIIVDSTFNMPPERIQGLRDIGSRKGRGFPTNEEFIKHYKLRPEGTTATQDVMRHLAQYGARQMDDGLWRHKFDRNVYSTRIGMNALPLWEKIKVPAMVIKGDLSNRVSAEVQAKVRELCPQIEFAEVHNCDHHVMLDNPAGFVDAVNAFLDRNAGK